MKSLKKLLVYITILVLIIVPSVSFAKNNVPYKFEEPNGPIIDHYYVTETRFYSSWDNVPKEIYVSRTSPAGYNYAGYIPRVRNLRYSNGDYEVKFSGSIGLSSPNY